MVAQVKAQAKSMHSKPQIPLPKSSTVPVLPDEGLNVYSPNFLCRHVAFASEAETGEPISADSRGNAGNNIVLA